MKPIDNYYVINGYVTSCKDKIVYFNRYQLAIFKKNGESFYVRSFYNIKAICHKKLSTRFANKLYHPTIFGEDVQTFEKKHCDNLEDCVNRYLHINKSLNYNVKVLSSYETK